MGREKKSKGTEQDMVVKAQNKRVSLKLGELCTKSDNSKLTKKDTERSTTWTNVLRHLNTTLVFNCANILCKAMGINLVFHQILEHGCWDFLP